MMSRGGGVGELSRTPPGQEPPGHAALSSLSPLYTPALHRLGLDRLPAGGPHTGPPLSAVDLHGDRAVHEGQAVLPAAGLTHRLTELNLPCL